jgi:uncharacterized protein YecT (DUF1311 family)
MSGKAPSPLGVDVPRRRSVCARGHRIVGVGLVVALLSLVSVTATRAATAPAPPVMHERFTPLPCSGKPGSRTDLQQTGCSEQDILRTDRQIDALNRTIFYRLFDTESRRDFVAGHRAWLRYRDSYCLSVSDVFRGGTEAGVLAASCTDEVNSQHVRDLREFAADLPSG